MTHILSLSYGKDSLACLEACKLLGYPIDRVIHAEVWATQDIPADLPPMVEFKKKADAIIKEKYGLIVEHISAQRERERERESGLITSSCSTPCSARERMSEESTDSLSSEDSGVPQTSRQRFLTESQKDTFEQMFYHIPTRKNPEKQGLIKGFPGVLQSKWCVKLKVRCFLKAPLHKELIQILCNTSALPPMNPNALSGTLAPVSFSHWWT